MAVSDSERAAEGRRQFVRFLAVGAVNTAVGYGLFAAFVAIGLHYSVAVFLSTVLGILFNFQTIGRLVFRAHDPSRILRFFAVYGVTYVLNVAGLRALKEAGVGAYAGGALLLAPMAVVSFLLQRAFVFRREVTDP
jgi:putative flippase GtrA